MMFLLRNKRLWAFVGGVIATEVIKSGTFHNMAVKSVAKGMKVQKSIKASIQNIKEEAEDLCYDEQAQITEEE